MARREWLSPVHRGFLVKLPCRRSELDGRTLNALLRKKWVELRAAAELPDGTSIQWVRRTDLGDEALLCDNRGDSVENLR